MLKQLVGHYRVLRLIGQGGMGSVYEAVHESIGQRVAIKTLNHEMTQDPELVRRFLNEARALSTLDHPGIVKAFDYGCLADGTVYIMMERLAGETLYARLRRMAGNLPVQETLHLTRQIADALCAAHQQGIVHRDVKPGNVMIVQDREAAGGERTKLLDFGLVKLLSGTGGTDGYTVLETRKGMLMGTPDYMSPEQCVGGAVDTKADVYSLGILLYRLLSGEVPFTSADPVATIDMHLRQAPRPLIERVASLPAGLDALVQVMLFKDPKLRPSMSQVSARLREIEEEGPGMTKASLVKDAELCAATTFFLMPRPGRGMPHFAQDCWRSARPRIGLMAALILALIMI